MEDQMAYTDTAPTSSRSAQSGRAQKRGFFIGATEARPGIMTTEFWLTILAAATVVIAAYVSDTFDNDLGWAVFGGLIAAYVLSRGIAKAGSREGPFLGEIGDDSQR
jgi:hypothetical protein